MNRLLLIFFFSTYSFISLAQKDVDFDSSPSFFDRVYFGGGLGFSSSNHATYLTLSPIVGYMITENLSAGVGVQYQYIKYKYLDISDNVYGGSVFTRYNINQFFLQTEYNTLNIEMSPQNDADNRRNLNRFLLGGGISQPLGRSGRVNILGMYDLIYEANGPFASPWVFRIFFSL